MTGNLADKLPWQVEKVLLPSETVLWIGRPKRQFLVFEPFNYMLLPLFVAFLISVAVMVFLFRFDAPARLIIALGLAALLLALFGTARTLVADWLQRKEALYAVTNRRALIYQGSRLPVRSVELNSQTRLRRSCAFPDTIDFNPGGRNFLRDHGLLPLRWIGKHLPEARPLAFEMLSDVAEVTALIEQVKVRNA